MPSSSPTRSGLTSSAAAVGVGAVDPRQVWAGVDARLARLAPLMQDCAALAPPAGVGLTVGSFLLLTGATFMGGVVAVQWYLGVWWAGLIAGGVTGLMSL